MRAISFFSNLRRTKRRSPLGRIARRTQSRNFGRWVGRPSRVFDVAPDCSWVGDDDSACRGDIMGCALAAFPRALPARRCTCPLKVRREFRDKFSFAHFPTSTYKDQMSRIPYSGTFCKRNGHKYQDALTSVFSPADKGVLHPR